MDAKLAAVSKQFRHEYVCPPFLSTSSVLSSKRGDGAEDGQDRYQAVADEQLLPSGGWLGELTVTISAASGMSDIIIFCGICIISWIVLRTSNSETTIILALGFDLVIPMQYHSESTSQSFAAALRDSLLGEVAQ